MRAAFCILIFAILQGTYGQLDQNIQAIQQNEQSVYDSLPSVVESSMADFLPEVDSMFDSVMQSSLSTSNFDLICYLNGQKKYEPWYTDISYHCMEERNYTLANITFWHDAFNAALPELNQLFLDAQSVVAARAECSANDVLTFASSLGQNASFPTYAFSQLSMVLSSTYSNLAPEMLYAFNSELQMIFSTSQSDPTYDAISALEDAEFKHLTVDAMTIKTACTYSRWYFVSNVYSYYTGVLDTIRHMFEDAILRGAVNFVCTGQ